MFHFGILIRQNMSGRFWRPNLRAPDVNFDPSCRYRIADKIKLAIFNKHLFEKLLSIHCIKTTLRIESQFEARANKTF